MPYIFYIDEKNKNIFFRFQDSNARRSKSNTLTTVFFFFEYFTLYSRISTFYSTIDKYGTQPTDVKSSPMKVHLLPYSD